jgi:hypothetical protein
MSARLRVRQQSTKIRRPDREPRHAVLPCHDPAVQPNPEPPHPPHPSSPPPASIPASGASTRAADPSRYGARNAVSAASISSGASSATQWPQPGMTRLCTSSAASFIVFAIPSPPLSAPSIARTGRVGRRFLRSSFYAMVMSSAVPPEAAAQRFGAGGKDADVVPDGVVGQLLRGLGGELSAEVDVFPFPDELFAFTSATRLNARCRSRSLTCAGLNRG